MRNKAQNMSRFQQLGGDQVYRTLKTKLLNSSVALPSEEVLILATSCQDQHL